MLLPLTPEQTAHNPPFHRKDCYRDQDTNSCRCHAHLLSDSFTPEDPSSKQTPVDRLRQRKVSSLNDMCRESKILRWPKDLFSPVKPVLPRYPPPVRSPTPPGLPSFGSPDAISYSSQFPVQSFTNNRQPQLHDRINSNRNPRRNTGQAATLSYGERWRRRLGLASISPSPGPNQQLCSVSRAPDGTAVLGRFPHRQSGHGMNVARRLDEHPFHRRTLTLAQCDGVNVDDSGSHPDAQSTIGPGNIHRANPITPGVDSSTRSQEVQNALPPLPNPAVLRSPRGPFFMNNISRCTSYQSCDDSHAAEASGEIPSTGLQIHSRTSDSPGCLLASTQTSMMSNVQQLAVRGEEKPVTWLQQVKTSASYFSCCLRTGTASDIVTDSNTCSHDTYATARSQALDESTAEQPPPQTVLGKQPQQLMRWCADTWKSLCGMAARNFVVTEPMLG